MNTNDPRIDAYIAKSGDFAKPILNSIRRSVHAGCPKVEETMKWGFPHFMYKGMLCSMAAFKHHCAFGFWKGSLVLGGAADAEAMGQFGRLAKLSDLPPRTKMVAFVRRATALNDEGVKVPRKKAAAPKPLRVPKNLAASLAKNTRARATFDAFSPSHKRAYIEWITEAKTDVTRAKRLKTAVEWMAEGKSRNWKYEKGA